MNTDFGVFRAIQLTVSFWGTNRNIYKLTQFFSKIQRSARIITLDVLFYPPRLTCVDCNRWNNLKKLSFNEEDRLYSNDDLASSLIELYKC